MNNHIFIFFLFISFFTKAQDTLMPVVFLDDVVISEENNGFSVDDFIGYVKNDTTFYLGFKHLRYYEHKYKSELIVYNKKNVKIGTLNRIGTHYSDNKKAFTLDDSIYFDGKIYKKNGEYKLYTPEAFDDVFFPYDTIDVSLQISKKKNPNESQNMRDAKTIGFSIGTDNVEQSKGGIRKKLAIFDVDMQKYYNYTISDTNYNNIPCYVFSVNVKNDIDENQKQKALIRKVVSYFDKSNFNVIYREYKFVYNNWFIKLDMHVLVNLDYVNNIHVPTFIFYKGYWKVLFFKSERTDFKLRLYDYVIE